MQCIGVLFLHVAAAIFAFGVAGLLPTALAQMRGAQSVAVLRSWQHLAHRIEPWFPIVVLVLMGLGGWLIALSPKRVQLERRLGDHFRSHARGHAGVRRGHLGTQWQEAARDDRGHPEGSVPDQVHATVMNPLVWAGSWGEMGLAAGILFLMPTKPSGAASVIIVAFVGLLAKAIGWRLSRTASRQPSQTGRAD